MQHRDIPDGQRHEPKGISTASAGQVYVANGNGSGSWQSALQPIYAQLTAENKSYTLNNGSWSDFDGLTEGLVQGIALNAATGVLTTIVEGVYELSMNAVVSTPTNTKTDITFRFVVDGTPGTRTITTTVLQSNEKLHVGGKQFVELPSGANLKIQITATDSITAVVSGADLSLLKVG